MVKKCVLHSMQTRTLNCFLFCLLRKLFWLISRKVRISPYLQVIYFYNVLLMILNKKYELVKNHDFFIFMFYVKSNPKMMVYLLRCDVCLCTMLN